MKKRITKIPGNVTQLYVDGDAEQMIKTINELEQDVDDQVCGFINTVVKDYVDKSGLPKKEAVTYGLSLHYNFIAMYLHGFQQGYDIGQTSS
jgi:hypothetical protein